MANLPHSNLRRMYSWWWDSHISPKNSRWLKENLTDMDAKVKSMIKLIEEDADSFARRAEMSYKKRPELMKMVEEFYRAYRALAERYDQSTRALLQASKTMTEANFPNQVPSGLTEDELEKFAKDNDSQNDPFGSRIEGKFGREKVRKGLSFNEAQEKEDECKKNVVRLEKEIETLRGALAKFEAEKESNLAHYKRQQVELFTLQEADKKTKDEVEILKIALKELEVEKGTTLSEYQKCLEKIEDLEGIISCEKDGNIELNARAKKAEDQAQNLKINLLTMESEKGTVFDQSKQLLKKISYLENKLVFATEEATKLTKRAEKAETEMEILKEALSKFGLEKEANAVQYQQSLDTILALQKKISFFEEEVQMFKGELESGVAKLNCAEEKYILLENKLVISEKYAKVLKENVEEAATEAKILKETVAALGVERDVNAVQYQDCMDTISTLENKIFCVEEEVHMLNGEIESGIAKLKGAEEKCILLENKLVLVKEESNKLKERAEKTETEAEILKVDIGKLGVEKEANAVQYQKSLNTILTLEKKISCAEEEVKMLTGEIETGVVNLKGAEENCILLRNKLILAEEEAQKHNERAEKVEKEAEILKNDLAQLALEKEANAVQYQQCLDTISTLTKKISCAEEEAQMIHEELENGIAKLKGAEENCILLTNKLVLAEEEAQKHNGRAEKAEKEAEILKNNVAKLGLEKEANTVQYQQCLDTISTLTKKISCAEEEAQMLNEELENGIAKLKGAEEKCTLLEKTNQYLYSELKTLNLKIGVQSEEITEKDREMGILWSRVQDERFRFVEAETAFQTLQLLHAQTEENLKFLTLELQNRSLTISNLENRNQSLLNENKSLNELNSTSLLSIRDMQNEIIGLSEHKVKLEEEIEHRVDQRNALQQDIYCLKEELNDLNKKYLAVLDENVNLKEIREEEMREKTDLLGKVEELEKVVEKNFFLEKLILDSNASLEGVKAEIFLLERSFKSVSEEKSTLNLEKAAIVSQLQVANENLVELSETNAFMKNLVSDAHDEIEEMKMRLKSMKESFQILDKEKLELNNEKVTLVSEAEITRQIFKQLEIKYRELEEKYSDLEIEKESALCEIVELQLKINEIKQKVETQIIEMENLHGKIMGMEKTSFTLREEKSRLVEENQSLVKDCMYLQDKNNTLERENILILGETASLSILSVIFKNIIREKSLEIEEHLLTFDKFQTRFENKICAMGGKLEELEVENIHLKNLLKKTEDNLSTITLVNSGMNLEKSAMVKDFVNLQEKNKTLEGENLLILGETASLYNLSVIFKNIIEEKYLEIEELRSTVDEFQRVGVEFDSKISAMAGMLEGSQIEGTKFKNRLKETEDKLSDITLVNGQLNLENIKLLDERKNLVKDSAELQEKINNLEGENILILGETASLSNLAVVFKNIISEKSLEIEALQTTLVKMKCVSVKFEEKLGVTEGTLKQTQVEKRELNKLLKRTEDNLSAITLVIGQLNSEIENGNELLRQKETEICNAKSKVAKIETGNSELHCLVADLKEKNGDIEMYLETEATKLTSELYTTSVVRALLEEKFNKLVGVLKCIEEETNCKDKEIELLTKKISLLEGENGALGARLAEYAPAISSLKDCISSLENSTWLFEAGVENHVKSHEGSNADQKKMNDLLDLLDMETRVKVVMRQIEELGPKSASNQEKVMPVHVNSESENKILTKDIMLDEISESSSSGLGRKECMEAYLADLNGNGKLERPNEKEIAFASVEIVEKDFGLGDLTISKRFSLPNQELDKPKILERLNSDSQKLVNLQTIVQDLKMKVDMSEKRMEGKSSGRESIGDQLVKAEEDIMQLCDVNGILIKNVDDSDDVKSVVVSEEKRNLRRRFSEQARKVSERIGQLQLEVQKIQFIMLKMDGENAKDQIKRKSRNTGIKRRISLRDYFGIRNSNRKRKRSFCSCVHPPATAE